MIAITPETTIQELEHALNGTSIACHYVGWFKTWLVSITHPTGAGSGQAATLDGALRDAIAKLDSLPCNPGGVQ